MILHFQNPICRWIRNLLFVPTTYYVDKLEYDLDKLTERISYLEKSNKLLSEWFENVAGYIKANENYVRAVEDRKEIERELEQGEAGQQEESEPKTWIN
jgi:hypothetical protein